MRITSALFEAHLKCATKCWLRSTGEPAAGNAYAEWVQSQNDSYRADAAKRRMEALPADECVVAPAAENLKAAKWRLAVDVPVQVELCSSRGNEAETSAPEIDQSLSTSTANDHLRPKWIAESRLHALDRVPSAGPGKVAQFVPDRFIFTNKLGKHDKLLLALDAFVLSEMLGREIRLGKIIHGDDYATLKVKTSALAGEVRKRLEKIAVLLSNPAPPDLVLNRHCAECEFQGRCRQKALEQDDLSLLAGMSEKERQKLRSKGIFTVTQLSYTFRPRRRPKRQRDKREKYHHSLKALAIREKKIHIVGSPELKIEGTPVYLDFEGLPDRDFYYLIGLRIGNGDSAVQHSLWADTVEDEGKIWGEFLAILETIEKPVLIHYGSYETNFLKTMSERQGAPFEGSTVATMMDCAINLVSVMFAQIYFPTYSNGLKEIAGWLGVQWPILNSSGIQAIAWRGKAESSLTSEFRQRLLAYNAQDCAALEKVAGAVARLNILPSEPSAEGSDASAVQIESLKAHTLFGKFASPISEFEHINKAARWNYQRDRVYVRSSGLLLRMKARDSRKKRRRELRPTGTIECPEQPYCPNCSNKGIARDYLGRRVLHDVSFGSSGVRRKVVEYRYPVFHCPQCGTSYGFPREFWPGRRFGRNLVAYILYQAVELCIPMSTIRKMINRLLGFALAAGLVGQLKRAAAKAYTETRRAILDKLIKGDLLHVDETRVSIKGSRGYVWVFTNLHEVAFVYSDAREGEFVQKILYGFRGVLVTDFFAAYDAVPCPQQKCLLHLVRDLNDEILSHPYNEELKQIVRGFAKLLKPMIETLDRYGLKKRFLRKHRTAVDRFYREIDKSDYESVAAAKCAQRLGKNREKLFTFLEHDGVPWNNNNAEHAIKALAGLRDVVQGSWTSKSIEQDLVLLSVCQTCKYMEVDFLDFLRSGEKDIHAFAQSRRGRGRRTPTSQPTDSPAKTIHDDASQL